MLAAIFLDHGQMTLGDVPSPVIDVYRERVEFALRAPLEQVVDAKTLLQERLTPLRVKWAYDATASGPPHKRTFRGKFTVQDAWSTDQVTVTGGTGASKMEADKAIAAKVLQVFDVAHHRLGWDVDPGRLPEPAAKLASVLVHSAVGAAANAEHPTDFARLATAGVLGSRLLKEYVDDFARWAGAVEALLPANAPVAKLHDFYRHVGGVQGADAIPFDDLEGIGRFVQQLDPESYRGDLLLSSGHPQAARRSQRSRSSQTRSRNDLCATSSRRSRCSGGIDDLRSS